MRLLWDPCLENTQPYSLIIYGQVAFIITGTGIFFKGKTDLVQLKYSFAILSTNEYLSTVSTYEYYAM